MIQWIAAFSYFEANHFIYLLLAVPGLLAAQALSPAVASGALCRCGAPAPTATASRQSMGLLVCGASVVAAPRR